MIVTIDFTGDDNSILKHIQHSVYGEMIERLLTAARDRYLTAARLLRCEDDLARQLRRMSTFDHRTLQVLHDVMAAFYRFSHRDSAQMRLAETPESYLFRLEQDWRAFVASELERLTGEDYLVRAICSATAFANTEIGNAAEGWAWQFLKEHYRTRGLPDEFDGRRITAAHLRSPFH